MDSPATIIQVSDKAAAGLRPTMRSRQYGSLFLEKEDLAVRVKGIVGLSLWIIPPSGKAHVMSLVVLKNSPTSILFE
jgi:hypothetical protein